MHKRTPLSAPGPFLAEQIKSKDPYELSRGHAIFTPPTGQRGAQSNLDGGAVLKTDPDVRSAGVDAGFSAAPNALRAPDISVGNLCDEPGWSKVAPPLAVEYADVGQDEAALEEKRAELFAAGTRYLWVVRLAAAPRYVEVHEAGAPSRRLYAGEVLTAPGVLRNSVPVEAMWDGEAANRATLRNLLNRAGYESLDQVRGEGVERGIEQGIEQGEARGLATAILDACELRGSPLTEVQRAVVTGSRDAVLLRGWLRRILGGEDACFIV